MAFENVNGIGICYLCCTTDDEDFGHFMCPVRSNPWTQSDLLNLDVFNSTLLLIL